MHIRTPTLTSFVLIGLLLACSHTIAQDNQSTAAKPYVFGWQFISGKTDLTTRGGTTKGPEASLNAAPSKQWLALKEKDLSGFEKDRRAILAMVGEYRVSFDFLEVEGYTADFLPSKPYRSWGTEFVTVLEDSGTFIELQHIMVMYFEDDNGTVSEPMVMKHWRQDWQFEDNLIFAYMGNDTWQQQTISTQEARGTWSQSVYQVDDSPRYASYGPWTHNASFSSWQSEPTWRPLPRREKSVRDDYQVLLGNNRQTVLPTGWVHEEDNFKMKLSGTNIVDVNTPYLAKEIGVARYERISDHDFSQGYDYLTKSSKFWQSVRQKWQLLENTKQSLNISSAVDGQFMFMPIFGRAQSIVEGKQFSEAENALWIETLLDKHIKQ